LKDDQTGKGCQLLLFKLQGGNTARLTINIGFSLLHSWWPLFQVGFCSYKPKPILWGGHLPSFLYHSNFDFIETEGFSLNSRGRSSHERSLEWKQRIRWKIRFRSGSSGETPRRNLRELQGLHWMWVGRIGIRWVECWSAERISILYYVCCMILSLHISFMYCMSGDQHFSLPLRPDSDG